MGPLTARRAANTREMLTPDTELREARPVKPSIPPRSSGPSVATNMVVSVVRTSAETRADSAGCHAGFESPQILALCGDLSLEASHQTDGCCRALSEHDWDNQ